MTTPMDSQIGGDWYSRLALQPVEVAMKNHWDYCAAMILKYLTRHPHKGGRQDLEKALHVLELRLDFEPMRRFDRVYYAADYVRENAIPVYDAGLFFMLWEWVETGRADRAGILAAGLREAITNYPTAETAGRRRD